MLKPCETSHIYLSDRRTFFDIPAEVIDLPTQSRHEKMGNLLLGAVVARHDDNELSLLSSCRWSDDRTGDEVAVWEMGDHRIKLSSQSGMNLV
jgi:hypothetical protein